MNNMTSINEMNAYERGKKQENERIKKYLRAERKKYLDRNEMARARLIGWLIEGV